MDIVYCHHAHKKKGNPPSDMDDISAIGVKDAKNTADLFKILNKKEKFVAIYTSSHYRCKRTVEILNKELSLPVFFWR